MAFCIDTLGDPTCSGFKGAYAEELAGELGSKVCIALVQSRAHLHMKGGTFIFSLDVAHEANISVKPQTAPAMGPQPHNQSLCRPLKQASVSALSTISRAKNPPLLRLLCLSPSHLHPQQPPLPH